MTTDDIVERVRRLMRLAENAAATEAGAASALERANALLLRHNLTMDRVAVSVGDKPAVTEQRVRTGWAGNWRGSALGVLARHNLLSSPIISRAGRVDTILLVGRPANVRATHAMRRQGYPPGFRVLCLNRNTALGFYRAWHNSDSSLAGRIRALHDELAGLGLGAVEELLPVLPAADRVLAKSAPRCWLTTRRYTGT